MNADDESVRALIAFDEAIAAGNDTVDQGAELSPMGDCLRLLTRVFTGPLRPSTESSRTLGRFRLLQELGHGSFGVVYLAEDPMLRRQVALKVLHAVHRLTPDLRQRFLREARLAASLDHPHVVRVHEAGEADGVCYIAEEYCPGMTLAMHLAGKPQPAEEAAQLVEALAKGVQHAHDKGVVHRDLKPGNILLTKGIAKVVDFGLAKDLAGESAAATLSGTVVGTPSYMAPEQAEGRIADTGPLADVWALGAVLYEMLVGRPPFQGTTSLQTLELVRTQEPVPPGRLVGGLPRDLTTICLKCLQKEPARRYASAGALADDLGRFLRKEPIAARPVGRIERTVKWARRHRASTALIVVTTLSLFALVGGSLAFTIQMSQALERVQKQKEIAEANDYAMRVALASREVREGHLSRARLLLNGAAEEPRGWEYFHLRGLARSGGRSFSLIGHGEWVIDGTFSPDGERIATVSTDGTVRLWDARDGQAGHILAGEEKPLVATFRTDGGSLLVLDKRGVTDWDLRTGMKRGRVALESALPPEVLAAWSPDRQTFATSDQNGNLALWDSATGKLRTRWHAHKSNIYDLKFNSDGRLLASGDIEGTVRLRDVATGRDLSTFRTNRGAVLTLSFRPGIGELVTGDSSGSWSIWDITSGRKRLQVDNEAPYYHGITFAPDGRRLAIIDSNGRCHLRILAEGQVRPLFHFDAGDAQRVLFSPDGRRLLLTRGPTPTLIDVGHPPDRLMLRGHPKEVRGLAWFPDRRRLATGSYDGSLKIWGTATGHELLAWQGHGTNVMGVAVAGGGRLLISASHDATARVWDAQSGRLLHTLAGHRWKIQNLCIFPDGRRLATASGDGTVCLWDVETGKELRTLSAEGKGVWSVVVSSNGRHLASGHYDGRVLLWDLDSESLPRVVDDLARDGFTELAFSPDGRHLAVCGGRNRYIYIWDIKTG